MKGRSWERMAARIERVARFAVHAGRSQHARSRLDRLAESSPVARAVLAVAHQRFTREEQRVLEAIDHERAQLAARRDEIEWSIEDFVGATAPAPQRQVVGTHANMASVRPHWGRVLYTLVREARPSLCVELGTCFGISGLYLLAALREAGGGRLVTFEGSRARAEIAKAMFDRLGFTDHSVVIGDFDRHLEPKLATLGRIGIAFIDGNHHREPTRRYDRLIRERAEPSALIVYDDIRWSSEMAEVWPQIRDQGGTRASVDLFRMGVVELGGPHEHSATIPAWLGWRVR